MPLITCGGMRFQHIWEDVDLDKIPTKVQDNLEHCVHYALDHGINHFETARGYGSSEMQLGLVLPKIDRDRLIVQTKVSPEGGPDEFAKNFEKSMGYLNLDYVDLLSIHGINSAALLEEAKSCFDLIVNYKRQGRIRHIGFSTHAGTEDILDTIKTGFFEYINLHWYFVNDLNWAAIEEASKQDMGVFIISPNDKGGKLYEPPAKLVELCQPLDPMTFNDLYCWSRPEVHTLSMGVSRPQDFDTHLAALEQLDKAQELISPIETRLRDEIGRLISPDWLSLWSEGLPEWEEIPNHINVTEILRLWTYAKGLDMVEFGKMRYNLLGTAGHWFPGLKVQAYDKDSMKAVIEKNPFAEQIPDILEEAHSMLDGEAAKRLSES